MKVWCVGVCLYINLTRSECSLVVVSCSQCMFLVVPRLRVVVFTGVGVCH